MSTLFARENLMERGTQHPVSLSLVLIMAVAQAIIYVAEISGIPLAHMLSFDAGSVEFSSLFFPVSHYAPVYGASTEFGAGFSPLDFAAGLMLWLMCSLALFSAGPLVESYLGSRRTVAALLACSTAHVLLSLTLKPGVAFSTAAFATFVLMVSILIHLEQRDLSRERDNDFRLTLLVFLVAFAGVTAAFMPSDSYDSLLPAVGVGPILGIAAFVLHRKLQMREVEKKGQGNVGTLYFVDEFDLLTREEIQSRMDRLLAKISTGGMNSLAPDERRFLANASGRLKAAEPRQTSR
jgi:membrane associated rhomboid family serine protease